jgi:hypothetical protein
MNTQRMFRSFRIVAVSLALAPLALSCDAVQPRPPCRAQMQQYAAKYTMMGSPTGNCAGKVPTAELVHMQYYRTKPDDPSVAPSLAIEPKVVFDAVTAAGKENPPVPVNTGMTKEYSIGMFADYQPDDNDRCKAATLTESTVTIGMKKWGYKWSNVEFITKPTMNSIHFGADLVRTEDDCTATFKVSAIYPAIYCGTGKKIEMDEMGMPHEVDDPTTGKPDNKKCDPVPGNNVHPDLALTCDASADGLSGSHLCVAAQAFPSLKPGK